MDLLNTRNYYYGIYKSWYLGFFLSNRHLGTRRRCVCVVSVYTSEINGSVYEHDLS